MQAASSLIFWVPPVFALVAILSAWLYYAARDEQTRKSYGQGQLYRCANCGRIYVEHRQVPMARCPGCDHLNEAPLR